MPNLALADNLNPQRRAFVDHYTTPGTTTFGNATRSAIAAGYSEDSARSFGSELLTFPDVRDAIASRLQTLAMSHEEVRARLAEHAAASFEPFVRFEDRTRRGAGLLSAAEAARQATAALDVHEEYMRKMREAGVLPEVEDTKRTKWLQREALRLEAEAERDPEAMVSWEEAVTTERVPVLDLEAAKAAGVLHLVKEVKTDADGTISIKLHDAQSALQHLDKMHTMLAKLQAEEGQGGEGDALTTARQKLRTGAPVVVAAPGSTVNVQINTPKP